MTVINFTLSKSSRKHFKSGALEAACRMPSAMIKMERSRSPGCVTYTTISIETRQITKDVPSQFNIKAQSPETPKVLKLSVALSTTIIHSERKGEAQLTIPVVLYLKKVEVVAAYL